MNYLVLEFSIEYFQIVVDLTTEVTECKQGIRGHYNVCVCIGIYMYMCVCMYVCVYIYIYGGSERERKLSQSICVWIAYLEEEKSRRTPKYQSVY